VLGAAAMIKNYKIVCDNHCEIYWSIKNIIDEEFYDFSQVSVESNAIYVFSRQQMIANISEIKRLVLENQIKAVLANPAEGADTMFWLCKSLDIVDLIKQNRILLIAGGDIHNNIPYLLHEHLLCQPYNYVENKWAANTYFQQRAKAVNRPYKFLFLNGRMRSHRKFLLERFRNNGLLDQSIWTNLDPSPTHGFRNLSWYDDEDITKPQHQYPDPNWSKNSFPLRKLPKEFEVMRFRQQSDEMPTSSVYRQNYERLFGQDWGEIYLDPAPYLATYFSLVTETTFDYMHSFRTEKIAKPLAIGHPWIAVASAGFYRDLKKLGFKTFDHLLDESFDSIDNPQDRIVRIAEIVEDLCQQDLVSFISAADSVCQHNRQIMQGLNTKCSQQLALNFPQYVIEKFGL
jgi:hypothetical protein